jgi:hypothetical protein
VPRWLERSGAQRACTRFATMTDVRPMLAVSAPTLPIGAEWTYKVKADLHIECECNTLSLEVATLPCWCRWPLRTPCGFHPGQRSSRPCLSARTIVLGAGSQELGEIRLGAAGRRHRGSGQSGSHRISVRSRSPRARITGAIPNSLCRGVAPLSRRSREVRSPSS